MSVLKESFDHVPAGPMRDIARLAYERGAMNFFLGAANSSTLSMVAKRQLAEFYTEEMQKDLRVFLSTGRPHFETNEGEAA